MSLSPLAGKPPDKEMLVDVAELERAYYDERPDASEPSERVSFGTSGHRGSSLTRSFNEAHILAITQAICDYRREQGITGPLYVGKDTHALSGPAQRTALEVLAANGVSSCIQQEDGYTPTPVISHAILTHNRGRTDRFADGVVITPSHNPPEDGGFKYNPPNGGPADTVVTRWIQDRANELLRAGASEIRRMPVARALQNGTVTATNLADPYIRDLGAVLDMSAIAGAGLALGVDPLGGSSVHYWNAINDLFCHLNGKCTIVRPARKFIAGRRGRAFAVRFSGNRN